MIKRLLPAALALIAALVFSPLAAFAQVAAPAAAPGWLATIESALSTLVTPAAIAYGVTVATAFLPKTTGPGVWAFVRGVLDLVAANFGNSANAK
jgi:hypothetical protein